MKRGVTKQQYAVMWRVMRCACARLRELEHGVTRRLPQGPGRYPYCNEIGPHTYYKVKH